MWTSTARICQVDSVHSSNQNKFYQHLGCTEANCYRSSSCSISHFLLCLFSQAKFGLLNSQYICSIQVKDASIVTLYWAYISDIFPEIFIYCYFLLAYSSAMQNYWRMRQAPLIKRGWARSVGWCLSRLN